MSSLVKLTQGGAREFQVDVSGLDPGTLNRVLVEMPNFNDSPESVVLHVDRRSDAFRDQTGLALTEALNQIAQIAPQSLKLYARGSQISDQTGMAMAEALKQTGLQSFTLYASETRISDQTGLAMAEALKQTGHLLGDVLVTSRVVTSRVVARE